MSYKALMSLAHWSRAACSPVARPTNRTNLRNRRIGTVLIHSLESRTFLSASQIHFADFSTTSNLVANGFGVSSITNGNRLRLTDGVTHEARSVWYSTPVPIYEFRSDFSFVIGASPISADGMTFTVQNGATTALGADGLDLGYTGIGGASEAAAFNMFNFGNFGSQFGFSSNGQRPPTNTNMAPVDLHSGHLFHATVQYDRTTLLVAVRDASNPSQVFTASRQIDLPTALGADNAVVGFTASTGNNISTQEIVSWRFSGLNTPTIVAAASASPAPVTARSTTLSVLAADSGGESNLSYTWSLLHTPPGAKTPKFSANGTNAAKSITAEFFKDGTYRFRALVTNKSGGTAFSDVSVVVQQTAIAMRITPHAQIVHLGQSIDYNARVLDQFNRVLRTQPAIVFSLLTPHGTIGPYSGLFTASNTVKGHVVVAATAGELTGTSGATVVA